jgi:hypothetical protein
MDYETRTLKIGVVAKGESIFHQSMTEIEIVDEAAGEFVKVIQTDEAAENGTIQIDPTEWPILRKVIDRMVKECR